MFIRLRYFSTSFVKGYLSYNFKLSQEVGKLDGTDFFRVKLGQ